MAVNYGNNVVTIGSYSLPIVDGSNGQVLATDGSGNVNWVPAVAGSANQVVYKDGSNVATGSNNFTFDGSKLSVLQLQGGNGTLASGVDSVVTGGKNNTASGNNSTVGGGQNNTASLNSSTVGGGQYNTSSNDSSTVSGGSYNTASGFNSTVGGGQYNTSSGNRSTIGGGQYNTCNNNDSTVGGGRSNTASGFSSTIGGGQYNTSSGFRSTISGGRNNTASGSYSTISGGIGAIAGRYGMQAYAAGNFLTNGDAQKVDFVLRNITTNNTSTTLFLNGNTERLTIPSNKALFATINIAGIINGGSKAAHYVRKVAIKNVGGTTSLIGTVSTLGSDVENDALYDVTITADNTNDALQINVTGKTGETIRWVAHVEGVEISYG